MSKQINRAKQDTGAQRSNVKGWLTWWTITQAERSESDLKASGTRSGIPQDMIDGLTGRTAKSAWTDATQLGAKGRPSATFACDPEKSSARYLTRDVNDSVRAIVREVLDRNGERASSDTVAQLYLINDKLQFNVVAVDPQVEAETRKVIQDMADAMAAKTGLVDDGRIRAVVMRWLEKNYRICVRGTGGVYFVPRPSEDKIAQSIEDELVSIRTWMNDQPTNSLFSIVEVADSGATSLDAFKQTAIEELREELAEVVGKLDLWQGNTKMNAGSVAYSADTMVLRCDTLMEKVAFLTDALGEEIAVVNALAEQVRKRAMGMRDDAQHEVDTFRSTKAVAKAKPAPEPVELKEESTVKAPAKKSGTAKTRKEKVAVE